MALQAVCLPQIQRVGTGRGEGRTAVPLPLHTRACIRPEAAFNYNPANSHSNRSCRVLACAPYRVVSLTHRRRRRRRTQSYTAVRPLLLPVVAKWLPLPPAAGASAAAARRSQREVRGMSSPGTVGYS